MTGCLYPGLMCIVFNSLLNATNRYRLPPQCPLLHQEHSFLLRPSSLLHILIYGALSILTQIDNPVLAAFSIEDIKLFAAILYRICCKSCNLFNPQTTSDHEHAPSPI